MREQHQAWLDDAAATLSGLTQDPAVMDCLSDASKGHLRALAGRMSDAVNALAEEPGRADPQRLEALGAAFFPGTDAPLSEVVGELRQVRRRDSEAPSPLECLSQMCARFPSLRGESPPVYPNPGDTLALALGKCRIAITIAANPQMPQVEDWAFLQECGQSGQLHALIRNYERHVVAATSGIGTRTYGETWQDEQGRLLPDRFTNAVVHLQHRVDRAVKREPHDPGRDNYLPALRQTLRQVLHNARNLSDARDDYTGYSLRQIFNVARTIGEIMDRLPELEGSDHVPGGVQQHRDTGGRGRW